MVKSAQKVRINLNLLYSQGLGQKLPIRFFKWLLSYGRFIVVVVEIVVLSAFVLRFKLDADLANLNERINNQIPYIESLSADEALIKQTQQRLTLVKKTYGSSNNWQIILTKISNLIPISIKITSLTLEQVEGTSFAQFKLQAQTSSVNSISSFLKNLKEDSAFKDITLTNISYEQGLISFNITGGTK